MHGPYMHTFFMHAQLSTSPCSRPTSGSILPTQPRKSLGLSRVDDEPVQYFLHASGNRIFICLSRSPIAGMPSVGTIVSSTRPHHCGLCQRNQDAYSAQGAGPAGAAPSRDLGLRSCMSGVHGQQTTKPSLKVSKLAEESPVTVWSIF
jgi:hypothetical protein